MLENKLSALKWTIRCSVILGIPFWIILAIYICADGEDVGSKVIGCIIAAILSIGYLVVRYMTEYQTLENYIISLQNKNFQQALTYGRSYYGIRRSGLKGAAGTYNTMYDEQAINNDINAYKE